MQTDFAADQEYMGLALQEAEKAAQLGEVPIGAVIVRDGEVHRPRPQPAGDGEKCPGPRGTAGH